MPSEALAKEGRTRLQFAAHTTRKQYALCNLAKGVGPVHYVYLLQSERFPDQRYIGVTSDLKKRIPDHNSGKSAHTSKYVPWKLVTYVAFSDRHKAEIFERYLKSGSGHAFANKRFW